ncbi:hypothetical protein, partial [Microcoleus sp. herbarium5]|uniref:hypothetical protein n=1 Tax=Microcoleus sp. herbarium5 TaxID=3055434 RepID=UPI002FD3E512
LMTTAVLLRSGMMGNYHVPFCRAVEEATPSLTLIILRKVATMLGFNLSGVGRVPLTAPQRIKLWSAKKTLRDGVSTRPEVSA